MKLVLFCLLVLFLFQATSQTQTPLFNPAKNLSKVGLQEIFYGDLSFYQERVLSKKIALEFGAGVVFRNFVKDFFQESNQSSADKMLIGPSFNSKIKYYPFIPGESFYFSADYKFRRYRTQYSTLSTAGKTLFFNEFSQKNIFRFGLGYIQCIDDHFCIDYYTSVGLCGVLDQNIIPIYNQSTQNFDYSKDKSKNIVLHYVAGIKFGYRF